MPVWHELTKAARANGSVQVVGITQEQHPDRCRLFAQWQGIDWPILWDPFNLTGSAVVPIVLGVDESGVVREVFHARRGAEAFEEFLATKYEAAAVAEGEAPVAKSMLMTDGADRGHALAGMLWGGEARYDEGVRFLEQHAAREGAEASDAFELGVAYRLRYDSAAKRAGDFQASLDAWSRALALNPNQYIWRRRIQQWGPLLDKPYPFYGWIDEALTAVAARGEEPVAVRVALTGSELARPTNELPTKREHEENPDPRRAITRDEKGLVRVETATALHTAFAGTRVRVPLQTARVHIALELDAEKDVHWTNDAGPAVVWVSVPKDWRIEHNLYTLDAPEKETSNEVRRLDFEVVPPLEQPPGPAVLKAFALYYVCEGESGECVYRRLEFDVPVHVPDLPDRDTDER